MSEMTTAEMVSGLKRLADICTREDEAVLLGAAKQLTAATARAEMLDAELLRVRTTGHAAAHELDNIAIECGIGHSPTSGLVAAHVRALTARAEKAEALYAKAWAECEAHRDYPTDDELGTGDPENENVNIIRMARLGTAMDDHDAKRREAGL